MTEPVSPMQTDENMSLEKQRVHYLQGIFMSLNVFITCSQFVGLFAAQATLTLHKYTKAYCHLS